MKDSRSAPPIFTTNRRRYGRLGYSEIASEGPLTFARGMSRAYCWNVLSLEFSVRALFASQDSFRVFARSMVISMCAASLLLHVSKIVCIGSKPQVLRPDTRGDIATVKDEEAVRNRAEGKYPRGSVGGNMLTEVRHFAVTGAVHGTSPDPAIPRSIDFWPEALGERKDKRAGVASMAAVFIASSVFDLNSRLATLTTVERHPRAYGIFRSSHGRVSFPRFSWSEAISLLKQRLASLVILPRSAVIEGL